MLLHCGCRFLALAIATSGQFPRTVRPGI
jgi:hypothetical protein